MKRNQATPPPKKNNGSKKKSQEELENTMRKVRVKTQHTKTYDADKAVREGNL